MKKIIQNNSIPFVYVKKKELTVYDSLRLRGVLFWNLDQSQSFWSNSELVQLLKWTCVNIRFDNDGECKMLRVELSDKKCSKRQQISFFGF